MKGKKIKQINNLVIYQNTTEKITYFGNVVENPNYNKCSVWTVDGRCLEDRMTLEQAEEFCKKTKDFIATRQSGDGKPALDSVIKSCESVSQKACSNYEGTRKDIEER